MPQPGLALVPCRFRNGNWLQESGVHRLILEPLAVRVKAKWGVQLKQCGGAECPTGETSAVRVSPISLTYACIILEITCSLRCWTWPACSKYDTSPLSSLPGPHVHFGFWWWANYSRLSSLFLSRSVAAISHPSSSITLVSLFGRKVMLLEEVALNLGLLQQLEVAFCKPLRQSKPLDKRPHCHPRIASLLQMRSHAIVRRNSPLRWPHFSRWLTPSL